MTSSEGRSPRNALLESVDWNEARERMKRVISANVGGRASAEEIEDLAGEGCVGLMRAVLRGVRNLEAMEVKIAKRRAIDWIRSQYVKSPDPIEVAIHGPTGEEMMGRIASPEPDLSCEEAQFYVRESLHTISAHCRELYEQWLATLNLRTVAERLGISHDDARQRWVRCRAKVREILCTDQGTLGDWARARARWGKP